MAAAPQNPNQAIDAMAAITVTHIVLMAVLAIAAVAVIVWGIRQARRRKQAQAQVAENFETAEAHDATAEPHGHLADPEAATLSADVSEPDGPEASVPANAAIAADLTQIKGLGPKLVTLLAEHGITRVAQIADLTPQAAIDLDAQLGSFQGRMARDRWIEQARLLNGGDRAGYEAAFGKLGG